MTDPPADPTRDAPAGGMAHGEADGGGPPPSDEAGGGGDPLVGRVLAGRYRILRRLGEGAMGSVYLGEHLRFGRKDAIKVLQPSIARDPESSRRFLRGARNASAINHRNVCTVYDFSDTDDGLQFLAMEFIDGEPLSETLEREGALAPPRAVHIVSQVAAALQAAHDLGIVHRDLKPSNVMLARARDGSDLAKVVDFDIAKGSREGEGGEVTRLGFVVGTPEYMSPEQLTGDPLDGRSDVYSLGLMLVRLLTGKLPVRARKTQDILVERLTKDPLPLEVVAPGVAFPAGLQAVLDRGLERRREDRYATAMEFAADLEVALIPDPPRRPQARSSDLPATRVAPERAAPSPPPSRSPEEADVPATRVSSPRQPAALPATPPSPGRRGVKRYAAWALGVAVVTVASWGGYVVLGGGEEPGAQDPRVAGAADPGDTGGDEIGEGDSLTVVEPPVGQASRAGEETGEGPGRTIPGDADTGERDTGETDAAAGRAGGAEETGPGGAGGDTGGAVALLFAVDQAEDVAWRQIDRLEDEGAGQAVFRASADTARMILDWEAASDSARAVAAFALGQLLVELGETADAIRALERALELNPDHQPTRILLAALRGGPP